MVLIQQLLRKIRPITPEQLMGKPVWVLGTGEYARKLIEKHQPRVLGFVCLEQKNFDVRQTIFGKYPVIPKTSIVGDVILASSVFQYRWNQLISLKNIDLTQLGNIYILDQYNALRIRRAKNSSSNKFLIAKLGVVFPQYDRFLDPVRDYFLTKNTDVATICPLFMHCYPEFIEADNVLIWGGVKPPYAALNDLGVNGNRTYIEFGFFPQKDYYYLDKRGVNEHCTLMSDSLDRVEQSHLKHLETVRSSFVAEFKRLSEDYILVPLQVPDDANVIYASRFKNGMQEFIDYICDYYPAGTKLLFKAHPKDHSRKNYNYRGHPSSDLPFITLLQHAELVHGITSSTLYEAALAGVPVISEGESLLNAHSKQIQKLLAAMVDRQVHVQNNDLNHYLKTNSNFIL